MLDPKHLNEELVSLQSELHGLSRDLRDMKIIDAYERVKRMIIACNRIKELNS